MAYNFRALQMKKQHDMVLTNDMDMRSTFKFGRHSFNTLVATVERQWLNVFRGTLYLVYNFTDAIDITKYVSVIMLFGLTALFH